MCEACLEDVRRGFLTSFDIAVRHGLAAAPTAAELERHARKFGPEGVAELAAELGLPLKVESHKTPPRRRTKGPTLKERVAEHVAAGRNAELIAELENLSPSRARRLMQEVKESE